MNDDLQFDVPFQAPRRHFRTRRVKGGIGDLLRRRSRIRKAKKPEDIINGVGDQQSAIYERQLQRAFNELRALLRDEAGKAEVRQMMDPSFLENLDSFRAWVNNLFDQTQKNLFGAYAATGNAGAGEFGFNFEMGTPAALAWAEDNAGRLITVITNQTRAGIKQTIENAFKYGIDVPHTARDVRDRLEKDLYGYGGLNERQVIALENYRKGLVDDDVASSKVTELVGKMGDRYRSQRAEMIARTEILRASNSGMQDLWGQMANAGLFSKEKVRQEWVITEDDLCCDDCEELATMDENQNVGLDDNFITPDGDEIDSPPLHPNCRCAVSLDMGPIGKSIHKQLIDYDEMIRLSLRKADDTWAALHPRSVYVRRPLLNGQDIVDWYAKQGVTGLVHPSEMHVTLAHSTVPFDWDQSDAEETNLTIPSVVAKGGAGSGNYGHSGRKGIVGGSGPKTIESIHAEHKAKLKKLTGDVASAKYFEKKKLEKTWGGIIPHSEKVALDAKYSKMKEDKTAQIHAEHDAALNALAQEQLGEPLSAEELSSSEEKAVQQIDEFMATGKLPEGKTIDELHDEASPFDHYNALHNAYAEKSVQLVQMQNAHQMGTPEYSQKEKEVQSLKDAMIKEIGEHGSTDPITGLWNPDVDEDQLPENQLPEHPMEQASEKEQASHIAEMEAKDAQLEQTLTPMPGEGKSKYSQKLEGMTEKQKGAFLIQQNVSYAKWKEKAGIIQSQGSKLTAAQQKDLDSKYDGIKAEKMAALDVKHGGGLSYPAGSPMAGIQAEAAAQATTGLGPPPGGYKDFQDIKAFQLVNQASGKMNPDTFKQFQSDWKNKFGFSYPLAGHADMKTINDALKSSKTLDEFKAKMGSMQTAYQLSHQSTGDSVLAWHKQQQEDKASRVALFNELEKSLTEKAEEQPAMPTLGRQILGAQREKEITNLVSSRLKAMSPENRQALSLMAQGNKSASKAPGGYDAQNAAGKIRYEARLLATGNDAPAISKYADMIERWTGNSTSSKESAMFKALSEEVYGGRTMNHDSTYLVGKARDKFVEDTKALTSKLPGYGLTTDKMKQLMAANRIVSEQMLKSSLPPGTSHITLYRGFSSSAWTDVGRKPPTAGNESNFFFNGVQPFSTDRGIAGNFGDVVLKVSVPISEVMVGHWSSKEFSGHAHEREFIVASSIKARKAIRV